jgi:hypothetical protein
MSIHVNSESKNQNCLRQDSVRRPESKEVQNKTKAGVVVATNSKHN